MNLPVYYENASKWLAPYIAKAQEETVKLVNYCLEVSAPHREWLATQAWRYLTWVRSHFLS